jgi:hypothetical protein
MSRTAIATQQTIWDCRFSRPGCRVAGVEDPFQPESRWMCIRGNGCRRVTEEECEHCPHWELRETDNDLWH